MRTLSSSFLVLFLHLANTVQATPAVTASSGGWQGSAPYGQLLKKGTPETLQGNVLSFKEVTPLAGMDAGVELKLDTGKAVVDVHLGPRWFVMERDLNIARGERLSIAGLKIQIEKKPVLIAKEVSRGGQVEILRESSGELKRDTANQPPQDKDMEALAVLTKRCAECHQKEGHPGAKFLKREALNDQQTIQTLVRVLKSGKMPPAHARFQETVEGKLVLDLLESLSGKK